MHLKFPLMVRKLSLCRIGSLPGPTLYLSEVFLSNRMKKLAELPPIFSTP